MAFRGIFVGVDRYASPDIGWLSCAGRDAIALDALFRDTLGEGGLLLVDDAATTQSIRCAFADLETCDPDDVVVVFFSGHGAPSHHLISHDTDPNNLDGTGVALDELTEATTPPWRRWLLAKRPVRLHPTGPPSVVSRSRNERAWRGIRLRAQVPVPARRRLILAG